MVANSVIKGKNFINVAIIGGMVLGSAESMPSFKLIARVDAVIIGKR